MYDDPDQLFVVATDAAVTNEAALRALVYSNANFGAVANFTGYDGSDISGSSKAQIAASGGNATAARPLRIMGWMQDTSNLHYTAAGVGIVVRLLNHFNAPTGSLAAGTPATTGL